ncbi:exosome complex exonuclease [Nitzschia inconspicua]|uniref:Exosome complex exonuclease n=1 Tax=Nitzschia inconspicua TaxID=303405 RepID=A0A9K3Q5X2_9STRA|nr:exosome complex exonuclease [Nitzschia inconspicua]
MPRRPARLANCYVPLVLPNNQDHDKKHQTQQQQDRDQEKSSNSYVRSDRRHYEQLRQVVLETSVIGPASGSSLVEFGRTKVLCEVHLVSGGTVMNNNNNNNSDFLVNDTTTTINNEPPSNNESPSNNNNNNNNNRDVVASGRLYCSVKFAPHIGINQVSQRSQAVGSLGSNAPSNSTAISMGRLNQQVVQQETGLSHQLTSALQPVVPLSMYPKCTIVVKVTILQDSGSSLSASITAATLALVDARVELLDLVTSCTVAVMVTPTNTTNTVSSSNNMARTDTNDDNYESEDDNKEEPLAYYLVDPVEEETLKAQAYICLAMTPNHKEVTLWSQSGRLSASNASQAMNLCREGCKTYHKLVREVWISKMTTTNNIDNHQQSYATNK